MNTLWIKRGRQEIELTEKDALDMLVQAALEITENYLSYLSVSEAKRHIIDVENSIFEARQIFLNAGGYIKIHESLPNFGNAYDEILKLIENSLPIRNEPKAIQVRDQILMVRFTFMMLIDPPK